LADEFCLIVAPGKKFERIQRNGKQNFHAPVRESISIAGIQRLGKKLRIMALIFIFETIHGMLNGFIIAKHTDSLGKYMGDFLTIRTVFMFFLIQLFSADHATRTDNIA